MRQEVPSELQLKLAINPLESSVTYLYPLKNIRKPLGFLMFSGGIDKKHLAVNFHWINNFVKFEKVKQHIKGKRMKN